MRNVDVFILKVSRFNFTGMFFEYIILEGDDSNALNILFNAMTLMINMFISCF